MAAFAAFFCYRFKVKSEYVKLLLKVLAVLPPETNHDQVELYDYLKQMIWSIKLVIHKYTSCKILISYLTIPSLQLWLTFVRKITIS